MKNETDSLRQAELNNCNFVKTVLMLIVVVYHSILYWNGSWFDKSPAYSSKVLAGVAVWMNSFHIYGFVLVSGYIFYALKYEYGKYSNYISFAINKAKRLLISYAFVSLIWVIPFEICFFECKTQDILWRFALGASPNQLWFLLMLFWVFILFHPFSDFWEKYNVAGGVIILLIYGVGIIAPSYFSNIFQIFRAFTYMPLFWIGFKVRQYGCRWLKKIPSLLWLAADILAFVILRYLQKVDGLFVSMLKLGVELVVHIIGALMAFVILQKLADRIKWKDSKLFKLFSKNSMPIYLFHQQVVYLFIYLFNGLLNPYVHATVNLIGAMLVSLLLSTLFMRFRRTRILIGEK